MGAAKIFSATSCRWRKVKLISRRSFSLFRLQLLLTTREKNAWIFYLYIKKPSSYQLVAATYVALACLTCMTFCSYCCDFAAPLQHVRLGARERQHAVPPYRRTPPMWLHRISESFPFIQRIIRVTENSRRSRHGKTETRQLNTTLNDLPSHHFTFSPCWDLQLRSSLV
jgi:hypothetical protein